VDVGNHTTACNRGLDQGVELLVSSDGELQMSWCNSLDLQVLGSVSSELQHLSSEVLEDSSAVDSRSGSNSGVGADSALEESVDSADWELYNSNVRHHSDEDRAARLHVCLLTRTLAALTGAEGSAGVSHKYLPGVQLWLIWIEALS